MSGKKGLEHDGPFMRFQNVARNRQIDYALGEAAYRAPGDDYHVFNMDITRDEALVVEAHLMLVPESVIGEMIEALGAEQIENDQLKCVAQTYVDDQMKVLAKDVEELTKEYTWASDYSLIALSSIAASIRSHARQYRKNGPRFYSHPAATASILEHACNDAENDGYIIDAAFRERLVVLGLLHDTIEHELEQDGTPIFMYENFTVSPLLIHELYKHNGQEVQGPKVSHSLMSLTKIKYSDSQKSVEANIAKVLSDPDANVTKSADTHHNSELDPFDTTNADEKLRNRAANAKERYIRTNMMYTEQSKKFGRPYSELVQKIQQITADDIRDSPLIHADLVEIDNDKSRID